MHNSHVRNSNSPADQQKSTFSPHPVIPPINTAPEQPDMHPQAELPPAPVAFSPSPRTKRRLADRYREKLLQEQASNRSSSCGDDLNNYQYNNGCTQSDSYRESRTLPLGRIDLSKCLPKSTYLPVVPIHLKREEELELRRQLREELYVFQLAKLKDIYVELTGHDAHLTGYIQYMQLATTLLRNRVSEEVPIVY